MAVLVGTKSKVVVKKKKGLVKGKAVVKSSQQSSIVGTMYRAPMSAEPFRQPDDVISKRKKVDRNAVLVGHRPEAQSDPLDHESDSSDESIASSADDQYEVRGEETFRLPGAMPLVSRKDHLD